MNPPPQNATLPQQAAARADDDRINLWSLVDVVIEQRLLIAFVTTAVTIFGAIYGRIDTPIFEANTLIQIEDANSGGLGGLLPNGSNVFDLKSPASAEIEILRSRLVIGQAVSNLRLDLSVSPKYLPILGQWLSRRANAPAQPGLMGLSGYGYVYGTEALEVSSLQVPTALEGQRYSVVLTAQGYELRSPDGNSLGQGLVGQPLAFTHMMQTATLLVASAVGQPGAEFYIKRASSLVVTESLQAALKISEAGRQSGVLKISLEGPDPVRITAILNEIGAIYVRQNVERKGAEAEKSIAFLNTQLPQLRKELETSELRYNQFRNKSGIFDLGSEAKLLLDQTTGLRVKLLDLQQKRKELAARYTALHPSLEVVDAQLKELGRQLSSIDGRVKTLPNLEQDLLRLTRDVKVNNDLYISLLNSFQQLRLVKEGKIGNVRLVDAAVVPKDAVKPERAKVLALAFLIGLLVGLAAAFLRNNLRASIFNPDEIEQYLGMSVFATVPHSRAQGLLSSQAKASASSTPLLAQHAPEDPSIESLRSLRTALQFAMLDAPNKLVLLTGPTQSLGKSFISANFAAVLSAGGRRVLLIDADMRKGHIHKAFNVARGYGLSELIIGSQTLGQVLHKNVAPLLDIITTGTLPPNPAELLMSPATRQLLQALSDMYDVVLIDTPPVLAVSDTQVLAPAAGTVFLLAREGVTTLGELQEASKRLTQSGSAVRGVIYNDVNIHQRRYGDSSGNGYKYKSYRYTPYKYGTYGKSPQN